MFVDYVMNGQGFGPVGQEMARIGFDPGYKRPFLDSNDRACVTIRTGRTENREDANGGLICNRAGVPIEYPVMETVYCKDLVANGMMAPVNNATTLRKNEWIELDAAVLRQARARLRAWADLAAVATITINGMAKSMFEWESMNELGEAVMDMDGLTSGRDEDLLYQLEGLPLPITHSDFTVKERKLMESRSSSTPYDTTRAEQAGRRVAELIEKHVIGQVAAYGPWGDTSGIYNTSPSVYGWTTEPSRITGSLTAPTAANHGTTVAEVLAMRDLLMANNYFGPYMLYHDYGWDQWMDGDYVVGTSTQGYTSVPTGATLRNRLRAIEGITDVRRLDLWQPTTSATQLLLVQMTPEVGRAVMGMPIRTLQWDTVGGLLKNFKVMAIMVPNIRHDFRGNDAATSGTGIAHYTVP